MVTQQLVRLFKDRYAKEWSGLCAQKESEVSRDQWGVVMPFARVIESTHETESEYQIIVAPNTSENDLYPRLGRAYALNLWSDEPEPDAQAGSRLVVLDFDHGNKTSSNWVQRAKTGLSAADEDFFEIIASLRAKHGFGYYLTNTGARLFGEAPLWLGVSIFEDYVSQLLVHLSRSGYPVGADKISIGAPNQHGHHLDAACYDLGRMHKAPKTPKTSGWRSGLKNWIEPNVSGVIDFEPRVLLAWSFSGRAACALGGSEPAPKADKPQKADYAPLKKLACFEALSKPLPLAAKGERHTAQLKAAGAVAARLQTADPLKVYALVLPSVEAALDDSESIDKAQRELWQVCRYVCAGQADLIKLRQAIRAQRAVIKQVAHQTIANLNACGAEDASKRVVLSTATGLSAFVFDETIQNYAKRVYSLKSVGPALREHAPNLVDLRADNGAFYAERHLAMLHSTPCVDKVRYVYGLENTEFDAESGTISLQAATVAKRFKPRYHEYCAKWLEALGGKNHVDLLDWLSLYTSVQRPLCALYLQADAGVGKNALAQALAALFGAIAVPYSVAGASFRSQLIYSPVLHIDESVPLNTFGSNTNNTSLFRQIVGSNTHDINLKNRDPIELVGFPRLIITANTADALKIRENLTPEDINAIQLRVGFIEVDNDRALALIESFSLEQIDKLIKNDLPEHVLWITENHKLSKNKTEGTYRRFASWQSDSFATTVKLEIGKAKKVAECIARWYLRDKSRNPASGIFAHKGVVFVNLTALTKVWEGLMSKAVKLPDTDELVSALRVLAPEGCREPNKPTRIPQLNTTVRAWRVDPNKLAQVARLVDLDESEFSARIHINETDYNDDETA